MYIDGEGKVRIIKIKGSFIKFKVERAFGKREELEVVERVVKVRELEFGSL